MIFFIIIFLSTLLRVSFLISEIGKFMTFYLLAFRLFAVSDKKTVSVPLYQFQTLCMTEEIRKSNLLERLEH